MSSARAAAKLAVLFSACALSAAGLVAREGWVLKGYPDPVHGAKVPTACAGVTEGVVLGKVYTEQECITMTALAMVKHTSPIMVCMRDDYPATPRGVGYLSEMGTFSVNIGVEGFKGSTSCREMKAGNYRAACDGILKWYRAGKVDCRDPNQRVCRGLWADRQRQHKACLETLP